MKTDIEKALDKVYKDGFNIYMMLNKLKKEMKRKDNFPDEVILRFCSSYWKSKPTVKNSYTYFKKTFYMVSCEYFAQQNQSEHEAIKKQQPIAQSIKDILKGMSL